MTTDAVNFTDRRDGIRLAGKGDIDVVVVDRFDQPVMSLQEPTVVNISAGGMAITARTAVKPGAVVRICVGPRTLTQLRPNPMKLQALECARDKDDRQRIRLRLVEGAMPAELIYNW